MSVEKHEFHHSKKRATKAVSLTSTHIDSMEKGYCDLGPLIPKKINVILRVTPTAPHKSRIDMTTSQQINKLIETIKKRGFTRPGMAWIDKTTTLFYRSKQSVCPLTSDRLYTSPLGLWTRDVFAFQLENNRAGQATNGLGRPPVAETAVK